MDQNGTRGDGIGDKLWPHEREIWRKWNGKSSASLIDAPVMIP